MATIDSFTDSACMDRSRISASISKTSYLIALPAELRNNIWALVIGGTTLDIECKVRIPWGVTTTTISPRTNSLALLRTCHQIYAETKLLPFKLNCFRFSSEDAFKPWLSKFNKAQIAAITDVRLVTWKAKHMVESRNFAPRRLGDVFPIERFEGLRWVWVEVRHTGIIRDCDKWACDGSELEDADCAEQEGRLRLRWARHDPRLVIKFDRIAI